MAVRFFVVSSVSFYFLFIWVVGVSEGVAEGVYPV
jgi:hypothetical protein